MPQRSFGKFKSIDAFLDSYKASREIERARAEEGLPIEERRQRRRQQTRDVVEVSATLRVREDEGGASSQHIQMLINVTELLEGDPEVNDDVERVMQGHEDVFLAVRVGDSMGITRPIEGLDDGAGLKLRGQWIPKDHAFAHGGEKMSVLHFTHHPVGFICVDKPPACYS
jgi:endonuclease G